jgi:hypothetical protein
MSGYAGVIKIVRFNWPWYVGASAVTADAVTVLRSAHVPAPWPALTMAALAAADFWLFGSLAISHYIYDRSAVSRGDWLGSRAPLEAVAIFHAGQDEASEVVARRLPSVRPQVHDFYDASSVGSRSLARARALANRHDAAIDLARMTLEDGALNLALVVFAAHEIRDDRPRADFFRGLARAIAADGRILVVEHLRDGWNFLAYGPGAFHFLPRTAWMRSFEGGGLTVVRESACTPFVRVFELARAT